MAEIPVVDMREIISWITIHFRVKHEPEMVLRVKLAGIFLKLAVRIMGCHLEFEQFQEDEWTKYIERIDNGCDD